MVSKGFHWRSSGDVRVLVPDFFDALGLLGGYSTRCSASSRELDCDLRRAADPSIILQNRSLVSVAMGVDPETLVIAEQVHGAVVAVVATADGGRGSTSYQSVVPAADALVTGEPSLPLAVLAADCAVLLVADRDRRAVAAIHCGRKGAALNIVSAAVSALRGLGASPASLLVSIGPSICPSCYEVGPEIASEFEHAFPWTGDFLKIRSDRVHLDLPGVIRHQLLDAGVPPDGIVDAGLCTACRKDLFYSYRRERGAAGRCVGVVSLAPPAKPGGHET